MSDKKTEPITKRNLPQVIKRLAYIKGVYGRADVAENVAFAVAYFCFILLGPLLIVVLSDPRMMDKLGPFLNYLPVLGKVTAPVMNVLMSLPDLWYIKLLAGVVLAYGCPTVLFYLVRIVLCAILPRRPWRFNLPKDPIEEAKKIYKIACKLRDFCIGNSRCYIIVITNVIIVSIPVLIVIIAAIFEENTGSLPRVVFVLFVAICSIFFAAICVVIPILFCFPFVTFLFEFRSIKIPNGSEIHSELIDLCGKLHRYWVSVDPQEAARVKEEELERYRRSRDRSWLYKGLPQYERYKADAARTLGYSSSSGGGSSYDRKLHDELDAAEYGMRISDRFGQDWVGYDPEGPGLDTDPDSPFPPGYDPEAYHGPDTSGL